jgi:hypothetical protein
MIVMDAPVIFSRSVAPVCLPPASTDPDQHLELRIIIIIKWKNCNEKTPLPTTCRHYFYETLTYFFVVQFLMQG